jgi:tagatose-1,6-bisphosphate aldolase
MKHLLKGFVEIRSAIEARVVDDFEHIKVGVGEELGSLLQSVLVDQAVGCLSSQGTYFFI